MCSKSFIVMKYLRINCNGKTLFEVLSCIYFIIYKKCLNITIAAIVGSS